MVFVQDLIRDLTAFIDNVIIFFRKLLRKLFNNDFLEMKCIRKIKFVNFLT